MTPWELLESRGHKEYVGEAVTILQHSLQTALFAQGAGASDALVAAALLHDIGHFAHAAGLDATRRGIDPRHEARGAELLMQWFGPEVAEPVRLHVDAKRYLVGEDPAYAEGLSVESQNTLRLQGGPMTEAQRADFEGRPHWREALQLRRWDDQAKIVGLNVPPVSDYLELLLELRL